MTTRNLSIPQGKTSNFQNFLRNVSKQQMAPLSHIRNEIHKKLSNTILTLAYRSNQIIEKKP